MAANDKTGRLPPFPDDVPTHLLLVVDYAKLKNGDKEQEVHSLYYFRMFLYHVSLIGHILGGMHDSWILLVSTLFSIHCRISKTVVFQA